MKFDGWMGAGADDVAARKLVKFHGTAAVAALAIVALFAASSIVQSTHALDASAASPSVEPARSKPARAVSDTTQATRSIAPSDADLILQAYAPHGG